MRYPNQDSLDASTSPNRLRAQKQFGTETSSRIIRRDVVLQVLDGFFLLGDHPLHEVANRNDAEHFIVLDDRKMTYAVSGHDVHALVHGLARSHRDH